MPGYSRPSTAATMILFAIPVIPHCALGQMMGPNPVPRKTIIPDDSVTVPMHRFRWLPVVEASINSKGSYRFVVDTGAPGLLVNRSLADELKLPPPEGMGGNVEIRAAGPGGQGLPASLHQVESLKIGTAEFRGIETIALDSPFSNDFDGVIGIGVFRRCVVTFDYPAGKFHIFKGELPPADGKVTLDFTFSTPFSAPIVPVSLNGKHRDFIIDTGAAHWFVFSKEITADAEYVYGPVDGPLAKSVDREFHTKVGRLKGVLTLGRHKFSKPCGSVEDAMGISLIGNQALEHFAFSVDQRHKRIRLARESDAPITAPPMRVSGMGLERDGESMRVAYVREGSSAKAAGLKPGDTILAIAGKPAAGVVGYPIWYQLLQGDSIPIRYASAGSTEPRDVEIKVMVLVP